MSARALLGGAARLVVLAYLGPLTAGSPQDVVPLSGDVPRQVLSVLRSRCAECHTPDSEDAKAQRHWDKANDLAATLAQEDMVVPGSPDDSDLWLVIDDDEMPPPDSEADPLTAEERTLIHDWIASGAPLGELVPDTSDNANGSPDTIGPGPDEEHGSKPSEERGANVRRWFGRLHPSIVHFPIALLLAAAFAEVLILCGAHGLQPAVRFCVVLGFLGAVAAASLGWLAGEFAMQTKEPQLTWHRWLGVGTAVLALLVLLASEARARQEGPSPWTARTRWLLLLTAVVVSVTGHLGGILTHGKDYLSLPW